ncbi:hypothetical protein CS369_06675 [Candidatus Symbiopectobacterium sp. 'North America']|uniref:hypothetical protein n=1 Tax=Candidatus Symbiopectobacterium sp. 'North America' TaxID=2794574 RepID=UPI0018CB9729|nr:hypothetical protein [Candidatus Symbiopectobacterium sp. 'North America']MBG6244553.1 hypothetical protein [Candidatus Symbiopectobacterium sp. 'North America']
MSEIYSLSLKILQELKEQIKAVALENQVSISAEVAARLAKSFTIAAKDSVDAEQADVDNQHMEKIVEQPFSQKELKKIRQLIKDKSKGASKKK